MSIEESYQSHSIGIGLFIGRLNMVGGAAATRVAHTLDVPRKTHELTG